MTFGPAESTSHLHTETNLCVCLLSSGSKGNCIYIAGENSAVLIDAGLSGIEIERRMASRGLSPKNLSAIIVSHEHTDHIQGVGVLSRKYGLPIYISNPTSKNASSKIGRIAARYSFACGTPFDINELTIRPFSTSHDADDPAGFTITCKKKKIGIATDLGIATGLVKRHLMNCNCLILEANHDMKMLEEGPYPWHIKQRIKSRLGHLSNEDTKNLLLELYHENLASVVLAHLSETNNSPEKALSTVADRFNPKKTRFTVALQKMAGPLLSF